MDGRKWFKEAGYGMMIHWGLYSLLGGQYGSRIARPYAEWIQAQFASPNAEYGQLARAFNPICFDADAWVRFARDCGMRYLVVTSKHHDGFALFQSRADRFNAADATPFGRDIIAEIGEACYRHGLKLGLYYSQDLDWHEPHGGGYQSNHLPCCGVTWDNSWDFPDADKKDYSICFENKIMPPGGGAAHGLRRPVPDLVRRADDPFSGAEPPAVRNRQEIPAGMPDQFPAGQRGL